MTTKCEMRELGVVRVARPCPANWSEMFGDERVRFCGLCGLNVYNLSSMTADDARSLLFEREGRLCVRFYARSDGTVMTKDCPRRRISRAWHTSGPIAAIVAVFLCLVLWVASLFGENMRRLNSMTG